MDTLLPCPFCGGPAECHDDEKYDSSGEFRGFEYLVTCGESHCYGNAFKLDDVFHSSSHAIEAWNTRPSPTIPSEKERL